MSDTEKTDASPQKEEVKVEEKTDMVDEKVKEEEEAMETEIEKEKEVDHGKKMEEDVKAEAGLEDKPASQTESVEATPKKTPKKRKRVEKIEDEEEEELPLGLLERPVVIESGKREKRKVERLSMTMTFNPQTKKPVDVPVGIGSKLGECPRIEYNISHKRTEDLRTLHRILFGKKGTQSVVKRNLRLFNGFDFTKDDKEYKGRLVTLGKLNLSSLKMICDVLDLEKMGVKDEIIQRVMDFLMSPVDSGKKVPVPKKKKAAKQAGEKKPQEQKKKRTGKKGEKRKFHKKQTSREDVASDDDDDDDEETIGENNKEDDDVDEDGDIDDESESEEEAPKKKKAKIETKKPKKEKNDKKEKKEKSTKKEKKEPKKKKVEISSDDDDDDSDSSSEPLASKKSGPPNNDELRDVVKKILDGANLEEVTMKTVVKQVYAKYPQFDLTDKKEFIKNTVKQLIS